MWLSLPVRLKVAVEHTPQNDERYADLAYSVNDTFKRARRQLQDQVRLMYGKRKDTRVAPVATVKRLEGKKVLDFLKPLTGMKFITIATVLDDQFEK